MLVSNAIRTIFKIINISKKIVKNMVWYGTGLLGWDKNTLAFLKDSFPSYFKKVGFQRPKHL